MLTVATECGEGFTGNLEQMFKDIELGREEMSSYRNRMSGETKPKVDLNVSILSAAAWPSYPDVPVIIPGQIKSSIDSFEAHYYSKHSGRKLQWKHALAHCQLSVTFPKRGAKGDKEFIVSSFQAVVLLLFNDLAMGAQLSYEHIKSESGLCKQKSPFTSWRRRTAELTCRTQPRARSSGRSSRWHAQRCDH